MNLGNVIEIHVNGKKMEGVIAFRLCANNGRQVEIERYQEKNGRRPYYDKVSDSVLTEKLTFPAAQVELKDTGAKFDA